MLAVYSKSSCKFWSYSSKMLSNIFIDVLFLHFFFRSYISLWLYCPLGFFLLKFYHTRSYFYLSPNIFFPIPSIFALSLSKFYTGSLFVLQTYFGAIYLIKIFFFRMFLIFYYFSCYFSTYYVRILCFRFFLNRSQLLPLPSERKLYFYLEDFFFLILLWGFYTYNPM